MSVFIPRWEKYKDKKPSGPAEINFSHWAADYLHASSAFNGDGFDLVSQSELGSSGVVYGYDGAVFDGDTARISTKSYDYTDSITIIARIKPSNITDGNNVLYAKYSDASSGAEDSFLFRQDTSNVQMFVRNAAGTSWISASAPDALVAGVSTDVAGSFDGVEVAAISGDSSAATSYAGAMRSNPGIATYFGVSNDLTSGAGYDGLINYAHVIHRGLSYDEIKDIHAAPFDMYKPRRNYWIMTSGATAATTGTATSSISESDIVAGGKTIILTLTGDTWVTSGATFDAQRQNIIDGLDSAQSETNGWDAEVKAKEVVGSVVRTSDTVVTITLSAQAAYDITAQETIAATIPATALTTSSTAVVSSPTFTVDAVSASTDIFNPAQRLGRGYGAQQAASLGGVLQ